MSITKIGSPEPEPNNPNDGDDAGNEVNPSRRITQLEGQLVLTQQKLDQLESHNYHLVKNFYEVRRWLFLFVLTVICLIVLLALKGPLL